jgi:hypothetical protein
VSLALFSVFAFLACGLGALAADRGEAAQECEPTGPRVSRVVETAGFAVDDSASGADKHPVVVLEDLQLCEGRPHRFIGGFVSTVDRNMLMGTDIRCVPAEGDPGTPQQQSLRRSAFSTRNHGDPAGEPRAIAVRWLFEPDRSGTFDCEVRAWGQTKEGESGHMTIAEDQNTVLAATGVEDGAREWRQEADRYLCHDPASQDPVCGTATYVLGDEFRADGAARSIDVYAGVEASICAKDYKKCTDATAGEGDFVIRTRLHVTQLSDDGGTAPCDGARTWVRDRTTRVPGDRQLNHTKIHLFFDEPIPVVAGADCSRTFAIDVRADYVADDPANPNHGGLVEGRIPDGDAADPDALNRYYTSAMALNNF